jgi:hypothetical protein
VNLKRISQLLIALGAAAALAVSPALATTAFQLSGQGPTQWTTSGTWNSNPGAWDGMVNTTRTVTNQLPSGTTVTIGTSGTVSVASRWGNNGGYFTLDDHGGWVPNTYVSGTGFLTPAVAISNFCLDPNQATSNFLYTYGGNGAPTNASYCSINQLHPNRGNLTFTFSKPVTNPVINFSGVGGYDWRWVGTNSNISSKVDENTMRLWTEFTLTQPAGATLTELSANPSEFAVQAGNHYKPTGNGATVTSYCNTTDTYVDQGVVYDTDRGGHSGCGSIRVNGTGTTFTFQLDYNSVNGGTVTSGSTSYSNITTDDTFIVSVSVTDDYGSAPASYDTSATYHTVGDLFMGAGVTPDALAALTPARDASGDTEASSTFRALPAGAPMPGAVGSNYSVTVPVTATAAGKVCGWVDWNNNGTYDTAERQCATFASGTANKTLTWAVPVGFNATATWMRLRASYDTTGVESPVGPLNSGEVEDYQLGVALAVDSPTLANTGLRDSSGLIIVAAMVALAGGATYLASMATSRPRRRNGN